MPPRTPAAANPMLPLLLARVPTPKALGNSLVSDPDLVSYNVKQASKDALRNAGYVNDALDALASASTSGEEPVVDLDTVASPTPGRGPRKSTGIIMDADRKLGGKKARCRRCEASLAGLRLEDSCGSCGAPVTESVDVRQLGFADRDWLKALYAGINVLAVGSLLMVIGFGFGMGVLGYLENDPAILGLSGSQVDLLITGRDLVLSLGSALIYGVAVWLLTRPRPDQLDAAFPRGLAQTTRWVTLPALTISALLGAASVFIDDPESPEAAVHFLATLPVMLIQFVSWVLLMMYLSNLARRVPDKQLAKSTVHVTIGVPAVVVGGLVLLFAFGLIVGAATGNTGAAGGAVMLGGCMFLIALLVVAIWYVMLLFGHRRALARLAGVDISGKRKRQR